MFNAGNSSNAFYVEGCIAPVADILVFQITGIAIMNVCLVILAIVIIPILIFMFPAAFDQSNPQNKQHLSDQREEERQNPNGGYYDPAAPGGYYSYPQPTYMAAPAYTGAPTYVQAPAYTAEPTYVQGPTYAVDPNYAVYQ